MTVPKIYDPYDPAIYLDPYPAYADLRANAPVYKQPQYGFYVLSRHRHISDVVRDTETFSSAKGITVEPNEMESLLPMMITTDPPRHTQLRKLVSKAFTPRRVAEMEADIRRVTRELLDPLVEAGQWDMQVDLSGPVPATVIAEMLGVPGADQAKFREWSDALVRSTSHMDELVEDGFAALGELYGYLDDLAHDRRQNPRDDMSTAIVHAEVEGQRLTHQEVVAFLFLLLVAGNETTTNLISNATVLLAHHPDQRRLLVEDPTRIAPAIEEILRFEPPVQSLARTTTREVEIEGTAIPADTKIMLLWASANRDREKFVDPDVFDVQRTIDANAHLSFGLGPHFCLGAGLARLEARVVFEELLDRVGEDYELSERPERIPSGLIRGFEHVPVAIG